MFKAKAGLHSDITVIDVVEQNEFARLTEVVCDHLASIQDALRAYQKVDTPHDTTVSEELQAVLARVRLIEKESDQTKDLLKTEKHKSTHDELTGLPNRAAYNERAFHELRRFKRYHRPLSLAVCDIDHFKKINDQYGHSAGDDILRSIAQALLDHFKRGSDIVCRYGGEEFTIILSDCNLEQAGELAEQLRQDIAASHLSYLGEVLDITVSIGVCGLTPGPDHQPLDLLNATDQALYLAKRDGRNCVRLAAPPTPNQTSQAKQTFTDEP